MNQIKSSILKHKANIKKLLGLPLTLISFCFILKIIYDNKASVSDSVKTMDLTLFFIGVFFIGLFFLIKSLVWHKLLEYESHKLPMFNSIYYYSLAEIKRYTPGNIFSFIARTVHFEDLGVEKKATVKLIFVEVILLVMTSALISIPGAIYFSKKLLQQNFSNSYQIVLFILLIIVTTSFYYIFRKTKDHLLMINIITGLLLAWTLFGIGNYFIATSIHYIAPKIFLEVSSFLVLSWLIGYLSLLTPSGLGVREAVIIIGLSNIIPAPIASIIAIFLRIGMIASEIGLLTLLIGIKRVYKSKLLRFLEKRLTLSLSMLILFFIIFSTYFTYFVFEKHLNFFTGRYDLGNMDQTVWNTLHGKIFMFTNPDTNTQMLRLGAHADFILILLTPFYLLWEDPRILLAIQVIVVAAGSFFVYLISQKILKNTTISLLFSVSYLLNPYIQKQILFDFHAVTLATTLLLAAFYFYLANRRISFFIFLFLACMTKENVYLVVMLLGVYIAIFKNRKMGIALLAIAAFFFVIVVEFLIPQSRGGEHFASVYYKEIGDSPLEVIKTIFLNPLLIFNKVFNLDSFNYLYTLLLPVAFLSLFSPLIFLISSSDLVINLLSSNPNFRNITFHYASTIIPFVYISAMYGYSFLQLKIPKAKEGLLLIFILTTLFSSWNSGVLPGARKPALEIFERKLAYRDEIKNNLKSIPPDSSISATNNLGPHLTHRIDIYNFPTKAFETEYVAVLANDIFATPSLTEQKKIAQILKLSGNYKIIYEKEDFLLLKKYK